MAEIVWIHYSRPRPAWYELSDTQRRAENSTFAAVRGVSEERGGGRLGSYFVRGQSDYSSVEVWTFPDVDAAFDHWRRLVDAGYATWFEASNNVGQQATDMESAHA